tara:strand:+ start:36 stop:146 length:111 start_codon:yes stop_codon:yes gene_type:complete
MSLCLKNLMKYQKGGNQAEIVQASKGKSLKFQLNVF